MKSGASGWIELTSTMAVIIGATGSVARALAKVGAVVCAPRRNEIEAPAILRLIEA